MLMVKFTEEAESKIKGPVTREFAVPWGQDELSFFNNLTLGIRGSFWKSFPGLH